VQLGAEIQQTARRGVRHPEKRSIRKATATFADRLLPAHWSDLRRCRLGAYGCLPALVLLALLPPAYNAGIAAGAALGALAVPLAGVRGAFLAGGLLTVGACAVLLGGRLLPRRLLFGSRGRCSVDDLR
jgi:hypothetical protein